MIPKKPAPDLIRGVTRFSEKIMLHEKPLAEKIALPTTRDAKENPRHEAGGYGLFPGPGEPGRAAYATLRFSAEVLPRLVTSSYSTV